MPLMTWQLWLAKDLVEEHHLPWQSSQTKLTPGRVAQSLLPLLIKIGTPASSPKTRGKSPGWKTGHPFPADDRRGLRMTAFRGQKRSKKKTYPIAKKSYSRPKKSEIMTA